MLANYAQDQRRSFFTEKKDDLSIPIQYVPSFSRKPTAARERAETLLNNRHFHGKRTMIRLRFESYCRDGASPRAYIQIPTMSVLLNCPTPAQAKAAIRMLQRVAQSMDGKFLKEDE